MYVIVDIETTGLKASEEKITEVAMIRHDGERELERWSSLINPEKPLSWRISQLTGITDDMLFDAPKFHEVAKKIVEFTEECTFVAHNARFDYSFIQNEFQNLGYDFLRPYLCTVRLARKVIPGHPSYSLGNISRDLDIQIENRHRAMGDAEATAKLFEIIMQNDDKGMAQKMLKQAS